MPLPRLKVSIIATATGLASSLLLASVGPIADAASNDATFKSPVCTGTGLVRGASKDVRAANGQTIRLSIYTSTSTRNNKSYNAFCGSAELVGATKTTIKDVDVNLAAGASNTTKTASKRGVLNGAPVWGGKSLLTNSSDVVLSYRIEYSSTALKPQVVPNALTLRQADFGKAAAPFAAPAQQKITANAGPDQTVQLNATVQLDGSKSSLGSATKTVQPGNAVAEDGLGGRLFSTGQPIQVTVGSETAGITQELWVIKPTPKKIATNRDIGKTFQVGTFPAGVEVIFAIRYNPNAYKDDNHNPDKYDVLTSVTLQTGPGSRNIDKMPHARVTPVGPGHVKVGFEDIIEGGDRDFNDTMFDFRGGLKTTTTTSASFKWTQVSGPPAELSSTTELSPTFPATAAGTYTFRLTVTSGTQTHSDDVIITVAGTKPRNST